MKVLRLMVVAASLGFVAPSLARAQETKPEEPKPQEPKAEPKKDEPKADDPKDPKAQDPGRRGRRGQSAAERLKEPLGLTDDQVTKIKKIEEDIRAEAAKAREKDKDSKPDRDEMRKRAKETRDKTQEKIRGVLTDDQKKKYDDLLKKQEEDRKKRQDQQKNTPAGKNT